MSLAHIRLNLIDDGKVVVLYRVESNDFTDQKDWKELGILNISKQKKSYEFVESELAKKNKIIPPKLYGISVEKREQLLKNQYFDYGWGIWSQCIHHWANSIIENDVYPDKYP